MEFDVRDTEEQRIEAIRVADRNAATVVVDVISPRGILGNGVYLTDSDEDQSLAVLKKTDALHLIKGLEKAIALGWLK